MKLKKLIVAMAFLPFGVQAQMVPAINNADLLEAFPAAESEQPVKLDSKERAALNLAREWINNQEKPIRARDGSVKYVFGVTLPTLVCAPLKSCLIELEPGEIVVDDFEAGDAVRWELRTMVVGPEGNQSIVVAVKPNSSGLVTNLIINTNRRTYMILLKSAKHEWMPKLSFYYPDSAAKALSAIAHKRREAANASTLSTGQNVAALDFDYRMNGESPWNPIRVYNDGAQTYIQFATSSFNNGAPALVALGGNGGAFSDETTEVVNYRVVGDRYVVDGKPSRMGLLSGAGKGESRVIIEHVGGKRQ